MTKNNEQNKQAYICPAVEVVNIEMQQSILAGSTNQTEELGERKADIEWSNESRGSWGNLWD